MNKVKVLPKVIGSILIVLSLTGTHASSANTDNAANETIETNNKQSYKQNSPPLPKTHARKPPQQAIDICLNKNENSACSFHGPSALEKGACEFTPDKQYFACNPRRDKASSKQLRQLPSHLATHQN
ncbi:hypothetical protein [Colwellia psychrerythraea]|uniref:Uncharacterized protein n=1 Tax=Colwellia psychrerythraea TaxID=28229 RepID=A0A099KW33_COLPS|nr:hypothetical protein [Colwellia psychrerythraea]KGJ94405.1 hypothetical protein ND2E_1594 [Colwellia psychrerythraea]